MTDAPPQLGQIPASSEFQVPTIKNMDSNTTNGNVQHARDSVYSSQVPSNPSGVLGTRLTSLLHSLSRARVTYLQNR